MIGRLTEPFFHYLPSDLASLGAAMVWGQKQYLTSQQYQMWQTTGLLHLLVLSGQNITLLVGFLQIFVKGLALKFRLLVVISVALFYLLAFGGEAPIVRASTMAVLGALTIYLQTTAPPLVLLLLSALGMLAVKPEWLGSLSFQLSFAATFGIVVFYPLFLQRFRFKSELSKMFFVSLSAQILTTPLLLFVFRDVSLLTLPINTVVAFLVEPIMVVGVLVSLVGNLFPPLLPVFSLAFFGLLKFLSWLVAACYPLSLLFRLKI
jgi:competence protein ComEC